MYTVTQMVENEEFKTAIEKHQFNVLYRLKDKMFLGSENISCFLIAVKLPTDYSAITLPQTRPFVYVDAEKFISYLDSGDFLCRVHEEEPKEKYTTTSFNVGDLTVIVSHPLKLSGAINTSIPLDKDELAQFVEKYESLSGVGVRVTNLVEFTSYCDRNDIESLKTIFYRKLAKLVVDELRDSSYHSDVTGLDGVIDDMPVSLYMIDTRFTRWIDPGLEKSKMVVANKMKEKIESLGIDVNDADELYYFVAGCNLKKKINK